MEISAGRSSASAAPADAEFGIARGSSSSMRIKKKARSRANSDDEVRIDFLRDYITVLVIAPACLFLAS